MSTLTASTNRTTHMTASTCDAHKAGSTAAHCRTTPAVGGTIAQSQKDLLQTLDRLEGLGVLTRSLPAQPDRPVRERRRRTAKAENWNRRSLHIAARAAEARFRALLEVAPDAIVITDPNGCISLVNRRTEVLFGFDRAELLGRSVDVLLPEHDRTVHAAHPWCYAVSSMGSATEVGHKTVGQRRDGSRFPVAVARSRVPGHSHMHTTSPIQDDTEHKRRESALNESERVVPTTFDALPQRICVLDETGTIVAVNKAWREFAAANGADRRRTDEGANYLAICDEATGEHADEAKAFAADLRAVMRGECRECGVEYPCQSTAAHGWYMCRATRLRESGPARFVVVHEDITELKREELALRAANDAAEAARQKEAERRHEAERRRRIAESLRDVISLLNSERPLGDVLDHITSQANRLFRSQAAAVFRSGLETEAVLTAAPHGLAASMTTGNFLVVDQDEVRQTVLRRGAMAISDLSSALAANAEHMLSTSSPAFKVPVAAGCSALLAVPIVIGDEMYGGLVLYNATPRHFTREEVELANLLADQAALAIENARRKQQAAEAAATQERNRLARDLHDAVTQAIFSANLIADALPRIWERDPNEGQRGLEQLHVLTCGALAEMRTLLFELRPAALLDKPLPDLLRQLTQAMGARSAASVTFEVEGTCALPPPVHVAVYRIAQEALNNVAKHAAARTVKVALQCSPQRLVLRIRDDGRGFDASDVTAGHFGIAIMQERARPIGATCSIRSHPGRGTQVTMIWPTAAAAYLNNPHSATADALGAREPLQEHDALVKQIHAHA